MTAFGTAAADIAPSFVDVRGRKTQVLRSGSGPALLYLHSAAGDTWWSEPDDDLARDFDVIHPALPGFEGSEGLAEMDDALDVAFHVLDLLDASALDRVAVVGSSLGGWVAAERRQVPARRNRLQARAGDERGVLLGVARRHEPVLLAAHDERRCAHAVEAPGELRVVQVGVPRHARRRLHRLQQRQDDLRRLGTDRSSARLRTCRSGGGPMPAGHASTSEVMRPGASTASLGRHPAAERRPDDAVRSTAHIS